MKYLKKGMSIVELETLKKPTNSFKRNKKINKAIVIEKGKIKIFREKLLTSKWWKLGLEQTARKGQGVRVFIASKPVLELDVKDIFLNLLKLTFKAQKKTKNNFSFGDELDKL